MKGRRMATADPNRSRPVRKRISRGAKTLVRRGALAWARLRARRILHILHIGKTGGTAIRAGLGLAKGRPIAFPKAVVTQHPHNVRLRDCPHGEPVVFFVRDPIERYVSGFWSRYRKGRDGCNEWQPGEAAAFARFSSPDALARALTDADAETQTAARQAMRDIGHVRDTLEFYLTSPDYLYNRRADLLHIGFQEWLNEDFDVLVQEIGASDVPGLPKDGKRAHHTPQTFNRTLSETALTNLQQWFAMDIRIYRTCREMAGIADAEDHNPSA